MGMPTVGIFNKMMWPFIEFLRSLILIFYVNSIAVHLEIILKFLHQFSCAVSTYKYEYTAKA